MWRQCQGDERFILWEQTNEVISAGLLADGKTVFSAGNEKVVRRWDLESRREIAEMPHSEKVDDAASSPDGRWLATTTEKFSEKQPVLLWDLATRNVAAILTTNFWLRPRSIIFSPDSQWLAFGTYDDGGIRLWDVNARSEITNLPAFQPRTGPLAIVFSPDGHQLVYNENERGVIALWDTSSRSLIGRLTNQHDFVVALAFSRDSQTLASGGEDRTTTFWNLAEQQVRFTISNHPGAVSSVWRFLKTAGPWPSELPVVQAELFGSWMSKTTFAAVAPGGKLAAFGSSAGELLVWDLEAGQKRFSARPTTNELYLIAFSPDGQSGPGLLGDEWDTGFRGGRDSKDNPCSHPG
jgi:WD40 repeat protein